jgi:hypothetical protein
MVVFFIVWPHRVVFGQETNIKEMACLVVWRTGSGNKTFCPGFRAAQGRASGAVLD